MKILISIKKSIFHRKNIKRFLLVLSINIVSSIILISALALTERFQILIFGAIPIIAVGWLFYKLDVIFSAVFIFATESIFTVKVGIVADFQMESLIEGIFAYTLFTVLAIIMNKFKSMSDKIHKLNDELIIKNKELEEISIRDHLTKLYNRRFAQEYLYKYAENFLRQLTIPAENKRNSSLNDKVMIIILADVDNFKYINDTYGHDSGDKILVEISKRLKEMLRFDDIIVRWGGEEFLLVCEITNKEYIEHIVKKILNCIRESKIYLNLAISTTITVSIGAAYFPIVGHLPELFSFDQTIILCDKALYESKKNGRDQACLVTPQFGYFNKFKNSDSISTEVFFENRECSTLRFLV
jgi:diguanylate cyclase (GGDEF)-like protein